MKPISEWTDTELDRTAVAGPGYGDAPDLASEVLRLRTVETNLREMVDIALADLAAWKAEHIPVEPLRWYTEWKRALADLAAARAELDDYKHMPCEECLTYAPGPEFAHLKAEKDELFWRLAAQEPVIAAALAWRDANADGFYGGGRGADDLRLAIDAYRDRQVQRETPPAAIYYDGDCPRCWWGNTERDCGCHVQCQSVVCLAQRAEVQRETLEPAATEEPKP